MTLEISFGWWLAPFFVTVVAILAVLVFAPRPEPRNGGMFSDLGGALLQGLCWLLAIIISLAAWLIWSLAQ
jgi:hypothetical protein